MTWYNTSTAYWAENYPVLVASLASQLDRHRQVILDFLASRGGKPDMEIVFEAIDFITR